MPEARPQPTPAELAILRVLWRRGKSTVRDVQADLNRDRPEGSPSGYTTVLKLMQIMTEKGLVRRNESQRTHVYQASTTEEHTQGRLVMDLLDRAFGGSAQKLVLQALSAKKASPEKIAQIRSLLDEIEKAGKERGQP